MAIRSVLPYVRSSVPSPTARKKLEPRKVSAMVPKAAIKKSVFLGKPGVGKGTFSAKLSSLLHIPHISTGDLIRQELRCGTAISNQLKEAVHKGQLLDDEVVLELLTNRLKEGEARGERGWILDGFPRNLTQAKILDKTMGIDLAVNMMLREDALKQKCLGRRVCSDCGQNFNVADVKVGNVWMPSLSPPEECYSKMTTRKDDRMESIEERLRVYGMESKPVEDYYRKQGKLLDFEVLGGIENTWPRLLRALGLDQYHSGTRISYHREHQLCH